MEDQNFLEYVVKALVDHPDDVKIDRKVDEMGVLITLDVNREDMGKIIGRNGNTAKAIRSLLRVVGMKNNARVNLKINEPEGGREERPSYSAPASSETPAPAPTPTPDTTTTSASDEVDKAMEDLKI